LIAAKNSAEESNRLKSAFLATMNHELRTPLNHILGFSELIMAGVVPEDNASFASSIQTSGQNLLSIIEDVFDLALIEQANIKLRNQTFSLMDHFMENKASFDNILRTSAKHEQIHLVFRPDTQWLSSYVTADRSKINQVLTNLFKNAVKFTHKGTIEFGYKIADESNLIFYIKDTGIGIAKEKQNIIFDFFRQGDDSYTRVYGGIGVGLSIARKITKILQGELTVVSELGKGSTFALSIPVELSASKDDKNNNKQLDLFNR
jgi:signal transduction histidine kinase